MEYNNDLEINDSGFDIGEEEFSNVRSLAPAVAVKTVDPYYGRGSKTKDFFSNTDNINSITSALGGLFGGGAKTPTPTAPPSNAPVASQQMYLMQTQQMQDEKRRNRENKGGGNTGMYIGIGVVGLLLMAGITIAIVKK